MRPESYVSSTNFGAALHVAPRTVRLLNTSKIEVPIANDRRKPLSFTLLAPWTLPATFEEIETGLKLTHVHVYVSRAGTIFSTHVGRA
jgi:hypothetical protein